MMHFGARERARPQGYCVQKVGVLPVLRLGSKLSKAVIKLHALHDDQSLTRSLHRLENRIKQLIESLTFRRALARPI